ncbi:hypothetical protein MCEMIH15_01041 [Caulobacteraceae bacterium]
MTSREIEHLANFISAERLDKLLKLTGDLQVAIKIHQDTLAFNCQLIKVVATIEIALRNTIYANIMHHFEAANWLQQPPVKLNLEDGDRKKIVKALDSAKRSEYAKKSQAEKAVLKAEVFPKGKPKDIKPFKYVQRKRENIPVSDGKIIAELTFAFWKRLYAAEYEHQLWRTTLKRTYRNKSLKRSEVSAQLEIVYQMRNRLAHHEPVVGDRFHKLIGAIRFVLQELNTKASSSPHPLEKLLAADVQQAISLQSALESSLAPYRDKAI